MKRLLSVVICTCLLLVLLPIFAPPARMINHVSLGVDKTTAYVGDTLTWTAYGMDGAGDYTYQFEIIGNNYPLFPEKGQDWEWGPLPSISWLTTDPGEYNASVIVRDPGWDDYAEAVSDFTMVSLHPAPTIYVESVDEKSLLIAWEPISGATGYELFCGTSQTGAFNPIGYTTDSRYTDKNLSEGIPYWYKVRSYVEAEGMRKPSSEMSAAASGMPIYVPFLVVKTLSDSVLSIEWDVLSSVSGYLLWRSNETNGPYTTVYTPTDGYCLDTGLTADTMYYYKLNAYKKYNDAIYDGPLSDAYVGYTMSVPLDAPVITSLSWRTYLDNLNYPGLAIDLAWTSVNGIVGYETFARIGDAGEYMQKTENSESGVMAGFPLPSQPTSYWFKVRAYTGVLIPGLSENAYICGPFSPEASIDVPALTDPTGSIVVAVATLNPDLLHQLLITTSPAPKLNIQAATRKPLTPEPAPVVTLFIPQRPLITLAPDSIVQQIIPPEAPPIIEQIIPPEAPSIIEQIILPDPVLPLAPKLRIRP